VNATGQQGGYLTKFANGFSFATVHYAGHEVPAYQPDAALQIFSGFLDSSLFSFPEELQETYPVSPENASSPWMVAIGLTAGLLGALAIGVVSYAVYVRRKEGSLLTLPIRNVVNGQQIDFTGTGLEGRAKSNSISAEITGINPMASHIREQRVAVPVSSTEMVL
jgi:hypothetical protein